MKKQLFIALALLPLMAMAQQPDAKTILKKVDQNMYSKSKIITATISIQSLRGTRTIQEKVWVEGDKAFTEILSPEREKGKKMLKLSNQLLLYTPASNTIVEISGNMLRQAMMGSDLSYEDMMDNSKLMEKYDAVVSGEENIGDRPCYVITLTAKKADVSYHTEKIWVDKTRFVPLKVELYAKTGKLLKQITFSDVTQVNGRWYPKTMEYKDMLKEGKGTKFTITEIQLDVDIPDAVFTKENLKR